MNNLNSGVWWADIVIGFLFGLGFAAGTCVFNALLGLVKRS